MNQYHKQNGTIEDVRVENWRDESSEPNTVSVRIKFDSSHQGFGGLVLDGPTIKVFSKLLCLTFGVNTLKQLKGKNCLALRSFGGWSEEIYGLVSVDTGLKMTVNSFRKLAGYPAPDVLEEKTQSLKDRQAQLQDQIFRISRELESLEDHYIDWDKENP